MMEKSLYILGAVAWLALSRYLFAANGTLDDPSGDGPVTGYVRGLVQDGSEMPIFSLFVLFFSYGGAFLIVRRGFRTKTRES
jgi:hypothetical protein